MTLSRVEGGGPEVSVIVTLILKKNSLEVSPYTLPSTIYRSAFMGALHCVCSYEPIYLTGKRVVYCISSFVTKPSGSAINQH